MKKRTRTRLCRLLLAGACAWAPMTAGRAAAEDFEAPKRAEARALFEAAIKLEDAGRFLEACPKLAESYKLDPGMGTLYQLAACYEKTGRLASAWGLFLEVADLARNAKMADREKYAQGRADALRVKLTKMIILVSEDLKATPGLEVKRDGEAVTPGRWGTALPVDPGKHVVSVGAPGKRSWETTVEAAGEGATVTVTIPALAEEPAVGPVGSAGTPGSEPSPGWSAPKIAGITAAGAGVAGLVVGGVLGGLAIAKNDDAASFCRPDQPTLCSAQGVALDQDVKALGTASTVAIVAGGVLAAGGVVLFLVAPGGRAIEGAAPGRPAEKKGAGTDTSAGGGVRELRARVTAGWIGVEGSW